MNPFEYQRADRLQAALDSVSRSDSARFLAGGTNLVDLMKNGVENPTRLIDINRLPLANIEPLADGGLRLGALARNSDTANHPTVRKSYPMLSQAILSGASPQLRNLATNGGNLLQRTRCPYFMDIGFPQCNKRSPGSGCGALDGINRNHAILGATADCIATNPSDMSVALLALEAKVQVRSSNGERTIAIEDFHRLPGDTPQFDTNLHPGELITSIDLQPSPYSDHSYYLKVRDRASYEFALVSAAVALELRDGAIDSARIGLGGVAHKPWRAQNAEAILTGKKPSKDLFKSAAQVALEGAKPYQHNRFKVELAQRVVVRALSVAGGIAWT